jgi:hypothetical protein
MPKRVETVYMVFEEIIRYSPRRRALHSIAEGFSPTARANTGFRCDMNRYAAPETAKPSSIQGMASLLRTILAHDAGEGACRICSERARIPCE